MRREERTGAPWGRGWIVGVWLAVALVGTEARAQYTQRADREALLDGMAAYNARDYATAAELLSSALEDFPLPTTTGSRRACM